MNPRQGGTPESGCEMCIRDRCSIFAKALARAGAKVALLGRNMDKLNELADKIQAEGGTAKVNTSFLVSCPIV